MRSVRAESDILPKRKRPLPAPNDGSRKGPVAHCGSAVKLLSSVAPVGACRPRTEPVAVRSCLSRGAPGVRCVVTVHVLADLAVAHLCRPVRFDPGAQLSQGC